MSDEFYSNNYIKVKQLVLFCFSSAFILASLFLSFKNNTITYWCLTFGITLITILLNYIVAKVSDIRINRVNIIIENLYLRSITYKVDEFSTIESTYSFVPLFNPFISPPFYKLVLKNGKKFIFYDDSLLSFVSIFKKKNHSKIINDKILNIINN
jgi:hypothetical protein